MTAGTEHNREPDSDLVSIIMPTYNCGAFIAETIATVQALLLKVLSTDDKSTDGAKLGAELRAQSKRLMDEADSDDKRDIGFGIAEWTPQPRDYAWH